MHKKRFLGESIPNTELSEAAIVILPVPFDLTSTWQKGADKGPAAILEASPHLEFYDIDSESEVYRRGIYTDDAIVAGSSEEMVTSVRQRVEHHLSADKFVVSLGGEHSISLGPVQAYNAKYKNLTVLQLDAHTDLRDEYEGSRYNHACIMARVKEICPIVQVGIRSMDLEEKAKIEPAKLFFAHQLRRSQDWIEEVVNTLGELVYVTIDLDVFDPGIMPATGTPEPGGLNWYQVVDLLWAVAENRKVVGFDLVELCPMDKIKAPDFLAAKLVYTFLSYIWR